nr:GMC family oxidoreductase [Streptomyces sp. SID8367]
MPRYRACPPRSRGFVRLASADLADAPLIDPRYYEEATDRELLVEGLRRALAIGDAAAMRAFGGPPPSPVASDDGALMASARTSTVSYNHPAGTCRSGIDGASVVDAQLGVHGIRGLRVADASVMPALPRAHLHAPSIMIGERAAGLIHAG